MISNGWDMNKNSAEHDKNFPSSYTAAMTLKASSLAPPGKGGRPCHLEFMLLCMTGGSQSTAQKQEYVVVSSCLGDLRELGWSWRWRPAGVWTIWAVGGEFLWEEGRVYCSISHKWQRAALTQQARYFKHSSVSTTTSWRLKIWWRSEPPQETADISNMYRLIFQ